MKSKKLGVNKLSVNKLRVKKLIAASAIISALSLVSACSTETQTVNAAVSQEITSSSLKVATWNIAWLGSHEYNKRDNDDYQQLAEYAKALDADVIALQEVENADYARKVFGDEYHYYFSTKDWVQRVGVAVRKSLNLEIKSAEYRALDVGRVRNGIDITLTQGDKSLRLLAVHLKSGCFDNPLDPKSVEAMPASTDRELRRKDACQRLAKQRSPLESWIDARASENKPFIVLGDFNRRFSQDIAKQYPENQGLWQTIDDHDAEKLWSPTLTTESKCWGGYYKDYIDHIVFDPRAKKMYQADSFSQLVFDGEYSRELSNALSDHCPIAVELNW